MTRALVALLAMAAAGAPASASARAVVVTDARGDVGSSSDLDLVRVSLERTQDGRLRAALSMRRDWSPRALLAKGGVPGSVCLRLWSQSAPTGTRTPSFLVCATVAADNSRLDGAVLRDDENQPTKRGEASVTRPSRRTVVLRFSQSSIGRPSAVRFAVQAVRGGCARLSCSDVAPEGRRTGRLLLRGG